MLHSKDLIWMWGTSIDGGRWNRLELTHKPSGLSTTIYRDEMKFPATQAKAEKEAMIKLEAKVMAWLERGGR